MHVQSKKLIIKWIPGGQRVSKFIGRKVENSLRPYDARIIRGLELELKKIGKVENSATMT
ncbi:unnamed protein product [Dovyalis caffra]|uniref:Ribosomal protein S16 n=1 Tax=Dovyalis caffra TaxID=77055 RepID=A0AAV1QVA5_9ROSI|nr:unnamed protein product [Dovyalis caffra]